MISLLLTSRFERSLNPAHDGADAGEKGSALERLDDVVVRAQVEPSDMASTSPAW